MNAPLKFKNCPNLAWILYTSSIQYFLVQLIVGLRFTPGYSLANNTISDLGNTVCGNYGGRLVCSPLHPLMNLSFIVLGITIITGSHFAYRALTKSGLNLIGFGMFAAGGFGTILVGLFPENTVSTLHVLGATLPFLVGNLGITLLGFSLKVPRWLRIYTLLTGLISLIALVCFMIHGYLGIGVGGMERIVAYPQTIWMIVMAIHGLLQKKSAQA